MIKFTKIIKKLAVSALLTNTIYTSELPELPEDHPITAAIQTTNFIFFQDPSVNEPLRLLAFGGGKARSAIVNLLNSEERNKNIEALALLSWEKAIDELFIKTDMNFLFLSASYIEKYVTKEMSLNSAFIINREKIIETLKSELGTYIHQSFERHFQLQRDKGEYAAAYNIAQVYLNHNTEHEENLAKANGWIDAIKEQAREHVKEIGEVIYALFLERGLQAKQISKATLIIESFKEVAPAFREELEKILHDTAHKKRTFDPIAAERLIVYREMADALFNCDDV